MVHLIDKDTLIAEIEKFKADALQKKSQCKRSGLERIMHQISAYNKVLSFINTFEVKEEPVSEDLEEAAKKFADEEEYGDDVYYSIKATFKEGANWQKEQFEKNRLAACDIQTPEEAEREMNFATNIIEKEHRTPTYDDAIKYGIRLQKEEMMKDAINAEVAVPVYEGKDLKLTQLVTTDVKLNVGDKVKLIIIKD